MHEGHANRERDERGKGQPVLLEQPLRANKPACHTKEDDNSSEEGTPPADEQCRLIVLRGSGGRRGRIEGHRDKAGYHSAWQVRRTAGRTMRWKG